MRAAQRKGAQGDITLVNIPGPAWMEWKGLEMGSWREGSPKRALQRKRIRTWWRRSQRKSKKHLVTEPWGCWAEGPEILSYGKKGCRRGEKEPAELEHRTAYIKSVRRAEEMAQWLECLPRKYDVRDQIPRSHVKMPDECSSVLEGKDKGSVVVAG